MSVFKCLVDCAQSDFDLIEDCGTRDSAACDSESTQQQQPDGAIPGGALAGGRETSSSNGESTEQVGIRICVKYVR